MAKKARRKKQTVLTQAQLEGTKKEGSVTTEKVVIETKIPEPATIIKVDFSQEYQYVVKDLKRIGILATVMFAVLILLNLFMR